MPTPLWIAARLLEHPRIGAGKGARGGARRTKGAERAEIAFGEQARGDLRRLAGGKAGNIAARQDGKRAAPGRAEILAAINGVEFGSLAVASAGGAISQRPAGGDDEAEHRRHFGLAFQAHS